MRGNALIGAALVATLAAGRAASEVRMIEDAAGSLGVEVSSTPRGPWTPEGAVTALVLNPSGDLFGDGMPGWDTRGDRVLSAWIRPGSAIVHQAIGRDPGWSSLAPIASAGAQGQPVVDVLAGGWSIAWQQSDATGTRVLVGATAPDGLTAEPIVAASGMLVGTSSSGDLLHVITLDGVTGQLWCTTVSFAFVPTQPIPIQLVVVSSVPLRRLGMPAPGSNGAGPPRSRPGASELLDPRVRDVVLRDGSTAVLVTWAEGHALKGVRILEGGPDLPGVEVVPRGPKDAMPSLLEAAGLR